MAQADRSLSPRFAKRHYEAIALAMQDARRLGTADQWQCVVNCLADVFVEDNCQFQRDRFKRACEPGANVRARSNGGAR
jgi:hypothetical protein